MKNTFAKRLKELRTEKGLSQEQLSKLLGGIPTDTAISLWETGQRVPNLDSVIELAKFFGVSLDYIAGLEN